MFGWLRHWKPIGGGMIIIALLGSYPATMVLSHKLPDQIADTRLDEVWADQRIGAAIELIQTEFEVRHWSDALPEDPRCPGTIARNQSDDESPEGS